eukprot:c14887_g1_i1 orf=1-378(-)
MVLTILQVHFLGVTLRSMLSRLWQTILFTVHGTDRIESVRRQCAQDLTSGYTVEHTSKRVCLQPQSLRRVFGAFDENGDGVLTREEFLHALDKLGLQIAAECLDSILQSESRCKDGYLTFEEFQSL